jgi:hypothetical protein
MAFQFTMENTNGLFRAEETSVRPKDGAHAFKIVYLPTWLHNVMSHIVNIRRENLKSQLTTICIKIWYFKMFWYLILICILEYRTITTENLQGLGKYQSWSKIKIHPNICLLDWRSQKASAFLSREYCPAIPKYEARNRVVLTFERQKFELEASKSIKSDFIVHSRNRTKAFCNTSQEIQLTLFFSKL